MTHFDATGRSSLYSERSSPSLPQLAFACFGALEDASVDQSACVILTSCIELLAAVGAMDALQGDDAPLEAVTALHGPAGILTRHPIEPCEETSWVGASVTSTNLVIDEGLSGTSRRLGGAVVNIQSLHCPETDVILPTVCC